MPDFYFGAWAGCGCTDVATNPGAIPATCPDHGGPRLDVPLLLAPLHGSPALGHWCGDVRPAGCVEVRA